MQIVEVKTAKDRSDFLLLPLEIYKNDPNWIRPLDQDIEGVFDPGKNKFFRHGDCIRWLLKDESGKVIGRVAAFINKRLANKNEQPTGGMGFFECINNKDAAFLLFDTCKNWLEERGMEAMDGPVNFGERDSWWGLMIEGFHPPGYKMNYNPVYYREFFESYGFQTYFKQLCFALKVPDRPQEKFYKRHAAIESDPGYKAVYLKKNQLKKFAEDFRTIYNKAWARHGGGKELESKQVQMFFKKMKPVIDEKIVWYVYYKDEPVAMWINIPDINQYFKKFNGKFGWFEKIRFFFMMKKSRTKKFVGLVFGVVPEHQAKGVDSFLIIESAKIIQVQKLYEEFEMQWIGDFNPKMIAISEDLGTWLNRTFITYRYLFDRAKEFKRHPVIL
ncbi:MAG TPA: hypothetical protein VJY62_03420 [Bacteroidia bacterium]|nr:hypothetical protein [Bacteroidia bacterium]